MRKMLQGATMMLALAVLAGGTGLDSAGAQQKDKATKAKDTKASDKEKATTGTATFERYKDKGGSFRFRFKDKEGDLLATSGKGYETKDECQKVIDAIRRESARAKVDDQAK